MIDRYTRFSDGLVRMGFTLVLKLPMNDVYSSRHPGDKIKFFLDKKGECRVGLTVLRSQPVSEAFTLKALKEKAL